MVGNRPEGAVLADAACSRDPAHTTCRVVGYGAQVGDDGRRRMISCLHAPGAGIGLDRLLDALGFATPYHLVETNGLLTSEPRGLDLLGQLAELGLDVVDPSG